MKKEELREISPLSLRCIGNSTGFLDTVMDIGLTIGPIVGGFILGTSFGYFDLFLSPTVVLLSACLVFVLSELRIEKLNRVEV